MKNRFIDRATGKSTYYRYSVTDATINVDVSHTQGQHGTNFTRALASILKDTFLPIGYPDSVRPEYFAYQLWDSVQGISSYLRSVLTTRSVLAGAGVGSAESSALAAALAWVFRDGIGMIGSLVFAYTYADAFEIYIKEWRYTADILNNIGLTLDLLSSYFPNRFFIMTSISTLCKACCGLVAGATKARISAHFAAPGHLADVAAKESTQETAVALCGLLLGMICTRIVGDDDITIWTVFILLLTLHQVSNYFLIRVLVFDSLNPQRCQILVQGAISSLENGSIQKKAKPLGQNLRIMQPGEVANKENFKRPFVIALYGPRFGVRLKEMIDGLNAAYPSGPNISPSSRRSGDSMGSRGREHSLMKGGTSSHPQRYPSVCERFQSLLHIFAREEFIVGVDPCQRLVVSFREGCSDTAVVKAYFVAFYLDHLFFTDPNANLSPSRNDCGRNQPPYGLHDQYELLISGCALQALQWFDEHIRDALASSSWREMDTASLYTGGWRYSELRDKKD